MLPERDRAGAQGRREKLGETAVFLLLAVLLLIWLIQLGLFDPKPIGTAQWRLDYPSQTVLARQLVWTDYPLPEGAYTVLLTAVHQSGEKDTGIGVLLGNDTHYLAVQLSPLGYVTVWQNDSSSTAPPPLLPWQPWPHVNPNSPTNGMGLSVQNGRLTVRVNGEWLWEGEMPPLTGYVGWIGESFAETAVWQLSLTGFSAQPWNR